MTLPASRTRSSCTLVGGYLRRLEPRSVEERELERAAERVRLLEVPVRPGGAAPAADGGAVADRRFPLPQRVRSARNAQGAAWRRWRSTTSTSSAPRARSSCSANTTATRPGEAEHAISSPWRTWSKVNLVLLDHPEQVRHLQPGHRAARSRSTTSRLRVVNHAARDRGQAALSLEEMVQRRADRVQSSSPTHCAASTSASRRPTSKLRLREAATTRRS